MEKKKLAYRPEHAVPRSSKSSTPVRLLEIIETNVPKLAGNQELLYSILSYLELLKVNPRAINLSSLQILCLKYAKDQYCHRQIENFVTSIKGLKLYMDAMNIQNAADLDAAMNTQKEVLWTHIKGNEDSEDDLQESSRIFKIKS